MPTTIEIIEQQIVDLEAAMAAGVLKVRSRSGEGEKEVTYPSFADLMNRLNWLKRRHAQLLGCPAGGATLAVFDSGR